MIPLILWVIYGTMYLSQVAEAITGTQVLEESPGTTEQESR